MKRYGHATTELKLVINELLKADQHEELRCHKVKVVALFVYDEDSDGEPTGTALTMNGYPAAAVVRLTSLKERAHKLGDVELLIDGARWDKLDEQQRIALIDHELTHVRVRTERETGELLTDAQGRPKLRMRRHDIQIGGFNDVIERHGRAALEAIGIAHATARHAQLLLEWAESIDSDEAALGDTLRAVA